jgi:hypothetical protein
MADKVEVLATIEGKGANIINPQPLPKVIETTNLDIPEEKTKLDLPADYEVDGPWVVPILGRRPLEPAKIEDPDSPYYYFHHGLSEADRQRMIKGMSPTLKQDPHAKLDPKKEIDWYFSKCRHDLHSSEYLDGLNKLNNQNKSLGNKNVEAAVALAVAGHQEHQNIYRTLQTYAIQSSKNGKSIWKGKASKFEILLYVNWPQGADASQTLSEIKRFQKDNPKVPVYVYTDKIDTGNVELGLYKKRAFDLALLRHKKRNNNKDILIIANDADMVYASPHYLEDVVETMKSSEGEKIDALLGRQDLDPEVYAKNPTFHAAHRFLQFLDATIRSKYDSSYTQGRNTVLRGSSYAAVGGNRTGAFYADVEFGNLFKAARTYYGRNEYGRGKSEGNPIGYSNRAWVMVDPRREIDKFKKGEKIASTWGLDFDTRDVRGTSKRENEIPENIDLELLSSSPEDDEYVTKFKKVIEEEVQSLLNAYLPKLSDEKSADFQNIQLHSKGISFDDARKIIKKAGLFLGVEFKITKKPVKAGGNEIEQCEIEITDTKKLREWLKEYRDQSLHEAKIKNNPLYQGSISDSSQKDRENFNNSEDLNDNIENKENSVEDIVEQKMENFEPDTTQTMAYENLGLQKEDEQSIENLDTLNPKEAGIILKKVYRINNLLYTSVEKSYEKMSSMIFGKYSPQVEGEMIRVVQKLYDNYNSRINDYINEYRPHLKAGAMIEKNEKEYASGFLEILSKDEGSKLDQLAEGLNNKLIDDMKAIPVFSRPNMTGKWARWDIARRYAVAIRSGETNFFENNNLKKEMNERRLGWEFVFHYKKNYVNKKTHKRFREEFDSACASSPRSAEIKALIEELMMKGEASVSHEKLIKLSRMVCEAMGCNV